MDEYRMIIMVAGYGDLASAREDFVELNQQVRQGQFRIREAVLISKDAEGVPTVIETTNHHGRIGAGLGASVGLLAGMIAPPMAALIPVGAAAGWLVANVADHTLKSRLRHEIGAALAAGTGVVIAVLSAPNQVWVEAALGGASRKSIVGFDESSIASIEAEVAETMSTVTAVSAPEVVGEDDSGNTAAAQD